MAEIVQLLRSPEHRYSWRPTPELRTGPDETVPELEIRAGLGVVGDRYFNRPAHRDAAVTVMAVEGLAPWPGKDLRHTRRTVLLRGVEVDGARGRVLSLDSGSGPVVLRLRRSANPCSWMDATLGPGAWQALRGHGRHALRAADRRRPARRARAGRVAAGRLDCGSTQVGRPAAGTAHF